MYKYRKQRHRSNVWARLLAFAGAFLVCLATLFPMDARARRDNPMVRSYEETKWGSLTLNLTYTKDKGQTTTPLDGAKLRLVRIADLSMEADGPHYTLRSGLTSLHYDFTKMTSGDLRRAARDIAAYIKTHPDALKSLENEANPNVKPEIDTNHKAVRTDTSDAQGKVSFDHLVHGVYLVTQEGKTGTASQFASMSPVLYFVPEYLTGNWTYNVEANPKYSPNKPPTPPESSSTPPESSSTPSESSSTPRESSSTPPEVPPTSSTPTPPTPPTPPKTPTPGTGDKIRLGLWVGTGLLALVALLLMLRNKRKDNDE